MRRLLPTLSVTVFALTLVFPSQTLAQNTNCHLNIKLAENEIASDDTPDKDHHTKHAMKKKHQVHETQFGGSFFMAPNQKNHVEGIFTPECGLRVVIFDAWTQPVSATGFAAFARYVPENEDYLETYRILMPSADGTMLHTRASAEFEGKFDIELFVKFPDSDDLVMFNIKYQHQVTNP